MSADQFDKEVMSELEEREYAQRMSQKWPCVALWPGKEKGSSAPINADQSKAVKDSAKGNHEQKQSD